MQIYSTFVTSSYAKKIMCILDANKYSSSKLLLMESRYIFIAIYSAVLELYKECFTKDRSPHQGILSNPDAHSRAL